MVDYTAIVDAEFALVRYYGDVAVGTRNPILASQYVREVAYHATLLAHFGRLQLPIMAQREQYERDNARYAERDRDADAMRRTSDYFR